jgi:hypothetical protein
MTKPAAGDAQNCSSSVISRSVRGKIELEAKSHGERIVDARCTARVEDVLDIGLQNDPW